MTVFLDKINHLSDNLVELSDDGFYAVILGLNPSKGARSPKLWNSAFKRLSINVRMIPIDVNEDNFPSIFFLLESDPNFLGGAIAAPHKEKAAELCSENLTIEAKSIGAINCLFRNEEGVLCGTNTDGEGSLISFESIYGTIAKKHVMILGAGGTGKAVASYFISSLDNSNQLTIASRSKSAKILAYKLKCNSLSWSKIVDAISEADIIINCTSLGSILKPGMSPLGFEDFSKIRKSSFIYDVIYDPIETPLLSFASLSGLKFMNGLSMNFEQAVIGFHYAATKGKKNLDYNLIKSAMKSIEDK